MDILLQPPYRYIVSFILFFVLFWLCQNYVLALTILALLAYTAIALLYMLMQQP